MSIILLQTLSEPFWLKLLETSPLALFMGAFLWFYFKHLEPARRTETQKAQEKFEAAIQEQLEEGRQRGKERDAEFTRTLEKVTTQFADSLKEAAHTVDARLGKLGQQMDDLATSLHSKPRPNRSRTRD